MTKKQTVLAEFEIIRSYIKRNNMRKAREVLEALNNSLPEKVREKVASYSLRPLQSLADADSSVGEPPIDELLKKVKYFEGIVVKYL